jgi:predicted amidohydrolase
MRSPRVAVVQASSRQNVATNVELAKRLLRTAADQQSDIIVFPELFLCGYDLSALRTDSQLLVEPGDRYCRTLAAECRELGVNAIVGAAVRDARTGKCFNATLVFDGRGQLVDTYAKVHLWKIEREVFSPGDRPVICELADVRVGLAICYDAGFPEHFRALALQGAELVACPSAFAVGEEERRYRLYFPTRSLENTVYTAVANAIGSQGGNCFFGDSLICEPDGRIAVSAEGDEGVVSCPVDLDALMYTRQQLPYLQDRITAFDSFR